MRSTVAVWAVIVLALCAAACGDDDGGDVVDADATRGDASATTDASAAPETDADVSDDAAAIDGAGGSTRAHLLGVWETTGVSRDGGPVESFPPGTIRIFDADGGLRPACGFPTGVPWELVDDTTIRVMFNPGETIDWTIVELSATELVLGENADVFYNARRPDC